MQYSVLAMDSTVSQTNITLMLPFHRTRRSSPSTTAINVRRVTADLPIRFRFMPYTLTIDLAGIIKVTFRSPVGRWPISLIYTSLSRCSNQLGSEQHGGVFEGYSDYCW
ncbi:hypothetical protein BD410DRAFT_536839 [Rickenella mellea]|uniref:Uncharacterized protein n=1 Tax=Rickenella mellea TaxID=50990 RepID=A0A4Y7PTD5_9AGAM|nr:hypothetical protein BD410DRAFT_536839 [Rickenella mellea]